MVGFNLTYFFVGVPLQQFFAFGYLFPLLSTILNDYIAIGLIMGVLFGFTHVAWRNPYFVINTTLLGLAWGIIYATYPNLLLSICANCVFGLSISLGLKGRSKALASVSD